MSHFIDNEHGVNIGTWRRLSDIFSVPIFNHLVQRGKLPDHMETHGLWYFLIMAHKEIKRVESDVNYEVDGYTELSPLAEQVQFSKEFNALKRVANMTASLYEVDLNDLFSTRRVTAMRTYCMAEGISIHPLILQWIASGGKIEHSPEQGAKWLNPDKAEKGVF